MNGHGTDSGAVPAIFIAFLFAGVLAVVLFGVFAWLMFASSPAPMPTVQSVPPSVSVPTVRAEESTVAFLEEPVPAEASKDDEAFAVAYKEPDAGAAEVMALKARIVACDEANEALQDRIQALEKEVAGLKEQLGEIQNAVKK